MAFHLTIGMSVVHVGLYSQSCQVPLSVLEAVDGGISLQRGTRRQEIGALSLHVHIGSNRIDRIMGHKVVHVQVTYRHRGIVAHGVGIEVALHLDQSPALAGCHVSKIACTISLHATLGTDGRQAVVTLHVTGQHGHHTGQILGTGLELYVGTQLGRIGDIGHETCCIAIEYGGQSYVQVVKLQVLHIATCRTLDTQRIVRPVLTEGRRHVAHKAHHVLTSYLGIQSQTHLARVYAVGKRQRHIHLHIDVALRGLQTEARQADAAILHADGTAEFGNRQSALFLEGYLSHIQSQRWVVVVDAVYAYPYVAEVQMVHVQPFHIRHVAQVVFQGSIYPVNAAHRIGFRS